MKEHFCPVEKSMITYQDKCNWCGESEGGMIETIKDILKGIDQTEIESSDGWWETSTGAKFGAEKLKQIEETLAQTQEPVAWVDPTTLHHLKIGLEGVHLVYETEMVNSLPLYDKPQRTWVGLTNEDMYEFAAAQYGWEDLLFAAEAKLKEKNCL
jgi:hypothetical protein